MSNTLERINRCHDAIRRYGADCEQTNLINLLADAMHWCNQSGEDFHFVLGMAYHHYMNELNPNDFSQKLSNRRLI